MAGIIIQKDKCVGCQVCVGVCPINAISIRDGNIPEITDACNLCGNCIEYCPAKAIVKDMPFENGKISEIDTSHLEKCHDIWVITEIRDGVIAECTYELLGEARRLVAGSSHKVAAVLLCDSMQEYATQLIARGADIVYVVKNPIFKRFLDIPFKTNILQLVNKFMPLAILFSATAMGRSLAPRLAAALHTGLSADCTELALCENGILIQTRPAFGGNLFASILCPKTWPQMATVRPKVMIPLEPDPKRIGTVVENNYVVPNNDQMLTEIVDYIKQENTISIEDAEIVVSAGYGASSERGLQLVQELADALGGAVGASRKVVDAGLIPCEHQDGQTGKTIGPKLYIACGVSGAIQHAVGMSSAKKIIAINLDADAPIFHFADIGIVADLYEFLPKLIEAVKARQ